MNRPSDLTLPQWRAVDHVDGPLLVLAGPGSGKTRVITRRIARMIARGVPPWRILAITFTNKAASEMQSRVDALLPGQRVWVSTFHKFCARLLRRYAPAAGLQPNYSIYDTADQLQVLRLVLEELQVDAVHYTPSRVQAAISRAKNDLRNAERYAAAFRESVGDHWQAVVAKVFPRYQQRLLEANAVDFDDLLLFTVELLAENPEIREELTDRFRYLLVDEYQDTNLAQYEIVRALGRPHGNVCVTGDPDQSIYGWRGARIDNILRFESDFPRTTVVRLEQNFRSTGEILKAADRLIAHNVLRKAKSLETANPDGEPVEVVCCANGPHEAEWIASEIRRQAASDERPWSDYAVFYRVNALSREMEGALRRHAIPYQVAAGVSFYERAEVKDVLAYLRLVNNPDDEAAFRRIVNTPARGIGTVTQKRLAAWAAGQQLNLLEAAARAAEHPDLNKRASRPLAAFAALINEFAEFAAGPVERLMRLVIDRTRYVAAWEDSPVEQDRQRLANVEELLTAARQFDAAFDDRAALVDAGRTGTGTLADRGFAGSEHVGREPVPFLSDAENTPLAGFLESVSLVSDVDRLDESSGCVTLMTLHAAKGLEFPVVFLIGVEQGLIPHERSLDSNDLRELEEERRLLFVGMTRAKQRLVLTRTHERDFRGRRQQSVPSSFLLEVGLRTRDLAPEATCFEDEWASSDHDAGDDDFASDVDSRSADDDSTRNAESDAAPRSRRRRDAESRPTLPRLMTAADLLRQQQHAADLPAGFGVGDTVRHPRYGVGVVLKASGLSRRRTVTVEFDDGRRETFVVANAPLQPVGLH
ncbi:MAG TPA: UvrD-helicase domain-containing protein [Planctomycetaceae bacterium]|nr:UvrD-helicase domain-containing protein [Planctomycetaceae bacterium]